ncbi:HopJ type III effector protein [Lishizhenia sp.]|uniref:HopJ type III effector protein n=1 Tax=Lishizhenia sp. TaxID=2497594 RepID=UPI00299CDD94|nr:HopJ type III effector protein [Lishizhenia sp.]MDX1446666.1 HopJ type III effector protein [Lishizhenia sp.]
MSISELIKKLKSTPSDVSFEETISVIEENYAFTPTAFTNGSLKNEAGQNNGSCKIFAFGKLNDLTKEETLACFGKFYFEEVLNDPNGEGHQNIRNFMKYDWEGITFNGQALSKLS